MERDLVLVAQVMAPHGLKGQFKLCSFTESSLDDYLPLLSSKGDVFPLSLLSSHKDNVYIASSPHIKNRTDADLIKNTQLYIERNRLPKTNPDEYYHIDLVGCRVFSDAQEIGTVLAVHDFGAGSFLDISIKNKIATLPFNRESVLDIDLKSRVIKISMDFLLL